jgi:carbonic anhydrase/acetyltransferase-like protein (isoleucine patch superfamily)
MASKKFELLADDFIIIGLGQRVPVKLHRIRALRDSASVAKQGELGGYIEREDNLSHADTAWIGENAKVYGKAVVSGDALVTGSAVVCGSAQILGDAHVHRSATVYGNVYVTDKTRVCGHTVVYGNVRIEGHAIIDGHAILSDTVQVSDHAIVCERATVNGDSRIGGYAQLGGDARVTGGVISGSAIVRGIAVTKPSACITSLADICTVDVGDASGVLTAYRTKDATVELTYGLFVGTFEDFRKAMEDDAQANHANTPLLLGMTTIIEQLLAQ